MQKKYIINKRLGETPLQALERVRQEEGILESVPMTYAGRLDPAAEGLLIILTGEECKKKDEYTKLKKTYQAEIVLGVATDSYDLLGIPVSTSSLPEKGQEFVLQEIERYLGSHLGSQVQKYPPYSSKTVDGIQLHVYVKEGRVVERPEHEVALYKYTDLKLCKVTREALVERVEKVAHTVTGDFRQEEILLAWKTLVPSLPSELILFSVTLEVSSGFYIRSLAESLGKHLEIGACLYSLFRTKIEGIE